MKFCCFCLLLSATLALPQQQRRVPVYFSCDCEDAVGLLYATKFRDVLATSPRYREVSFNKAGQDAQGGLYWQVSIVSMDDAIPGESLGASNAMSVVILGGNDVFMTHSIQTCGRNAVAVCAAKTLAFLDNQVPH